MKTITLTQGKEAWVDDEDYELVSQYNWHYFKCKLHAHGYAVTSIGSSEHRINVYMHVLIMNPPQGYVVIHLSDNKCNNQKSNLKICTKNQKQYNRRKHKRKSSKYKGVSFHKHSGKWQAVITINGQMKSLGYFSSEELAAQAYDLVAQECFGEFARLNFAENI